MRWPAIKPTPIRSKVVLMTGGIKEDINQLQAKAGELLAGENYEELDGVYHGYTSTLGYEAADGQPSPSDVTVKSLLDTGTDSNTKILLESNSDIASIVDKSKYAHAVTNTAVVDDLINFHMGSTNSTFLFNGSADFTIADNAYELEDNDFTIECFVKPTSVAGTDVLFEKSNSWKLEIVAGYPKFSYSTDGATWTDSLTSDNAITVAKFWHVAVIRKDDAIIIFVDGNRQVTEYNCGSDVIFDNANSLVMGSGFIGNMDELRVSLDYRYISDFDVPTTEFSSGSYRFQQWDDEDREAARTLIGEVPGSGSVLSVSSIGQVIGACRNDSGGSYSDWYIMSGSGWSGPVPTAKVVEYENGNDAGGDDIGFVAGETITFTPSGATGEVAYKDVHAGQWDPPNDAEGHLVLINVTGTITNGDVMSNVSGDTADYVADSYYAFTMDPDGVYNHTVGRFDIFPERQREETNFWCNGVNHAGFFDDTNVVPIIHENLPDEQGVYPTHCIEFKNKLFLAYPDGQIWYSVTGDPLDFDTATGSAGSFYVEGVPTGMVIAPGNTLVIFCEESIHMIKSIYDSDNPGGANTAAYYSFTQEPFSMTAGSRVKTAQRMLGEIYYMDDNGISSMSAASEYGDFSMNSISKNVQATLFSKRDIVTGTMLNKETNQYRIFFDDYTGLYFTFDREKKVKGVTSVKFKHQPTCFHEMEDTDGIRKAYFGAADGYVYEMDKGTSFNGETIPTKLTTSYHSYGTQTDWKWFRRIVLQTQTGSGLTFIGKPSFNYRSPQVPSTSQQELIAAATGAVWGEVQWQEFQWGGTLFDQPVMYMRGYGENMSLTITTESKYYQQHTINSMIVEYSKHARRQ